MNQKITFSGGKWAIPDRPEIGFIEGDGVGMDIMPVARRVLDAAVHQAYTGRRKIAWTEIMAGEKAMAQGQDMLPSSSLAAIQNLRVVLKGPLTTPVGTGYRSLNVTLRQKLDLFACVRPVRYFAGVPSPVSNPGKLDVVIFRENTEDVYAGIEWEEGTSEARRIITFLEKEMKRTVRPDSGIGIKPISIAGTKRLVRAALRYAMENKRKSVTIVHKGNIMKFTEGAFKRWGYQVATEEFAEKTVLEEQAVENEQRIIIKDRIADSMFQQLLLRPEEYDVIATTNLNGDYLSDACAAQVGGLGIAPGANINDETGLAIFEATHGTAPKYAGRDKVNPGSLILSGVMMLELLGWKEAAGLIISALEKTFQQKKVTYDLARQMEKAVELKCSEFGQEIVKNME